MTAFRAITTYSFVAWSFSFLTVVLLFLTLLAAACTPGTSRDADGARPSAERDGTVEGAEHTRIFYEEGRFAGWPANLGIWNWDHELLVGFVEARYHDDGGFHTYDQSTARDKFARSLNGGKTWSVEDAFEHGQTAWRYNNRLDEGAEEPVKLAEPIDFTHPDLALTFLRQTNNTGPSHFYFSVDRGRTWQGPYALSDLETPGIATRTDYLVDGPRSLTAFFTVAKSNEREGRVLAARTEDGGLSWERLGWVGSEPEGFEIMPASVRLSPSEILTVVRRREGSGQDLLSAYRSDDNGRTWERIADPVADTGSGGSPPALVQLADGRLALAYVVRSDEGDGSRLEVKYSSDGGGGWSAPIVLRQDGANSDAGYPRMVQRPDGKLVAIYYWNHALREDTPPWRFIAATLFNPLTSQ